VVPACALEELKINKIDLLKNKNNRCLTKAMPPKVACPKQTLKLLEQVHTIIAKTNDNNKSHNHL